MLVVNVRKMRVAVVHGRMLMRMGVRLGAIPIGVVAVLVVGIVAVWMGVGQRGVLVVVRVVFAQVQPNPGGHQPCCQPENQADRFAK
jgi:hypothetical protein